jgi:hypothetical protein
LHADPGWLVFFDSHSAVLTPRAESILKELASSFLEDHGSLMVLNGNSDAAEASPEDLGLGLRRAETVAQWLRDAGVRPAAIYTKDLGSTAPIDREAPDVAVPENRRVDLIPIGMWNENHQRATIDCKAWVRASCFGPLGKEQQALCAEALDILVPE